MRRALAGLFTVALMAGLLVAGARRNGPPAPAGVETAPAPGRPDAVHPAESRVQALLDSAGRGDVSTYLDAFTGALRTRLDNEIAARGLEPFADDLRAAAKARKSHAVFAAEPDGPHSARVTVEAVYPDRNERQTYGVERDGSDSNWRVTWVETVRTRQPVEKYGSPAAFLAPEGVPVQGGGVTVETGDEAAP